MNTDPALPVTPLPLFSRWRWVVCLLLMLATVINYMDRIALNQLASRIKAYFALNNYEYSLLESVFSFAFAVGAFTTGCLVDRISVRWVYPIMVLGWSLAGMLTGFASGFWMLLSCRFALGFFEAGNWPCGLRTTKAILRPDERSLGNSLFGGGTALGAVITPLIVLTLLYAADPEEPRLNAIMSVAGGTYAAVTHAPTDTWKFPFQVIGSLGVVWVTLWFIVVPRAMLRNAERASPETCVPPSRFRAIFHDRRFWVLFAMTVAVNVSWHGYRTWLPLYLQNERGYSEAGMSRFTTFYYLLADVGSWTIGGLTLWMSRGGWGLHRCRVVAFGFCAVLTLTSITVPFLPDGWALEAGLLIVAFGGLGLFPTYFALSQEISVEHQGKVTGTLGASAHFSLAAIYPLEGLLADATHSYALVLGLVGIAPLFAFAILCWRWPAQQPQPSSST